MERINLYLCLLAIVFLVVLAFTINNLISALSLGTTIPTGHTPVIRKSSLRDRIKTFFLLYLKLRQTIYDTLIKFIFLVFPFGIRGYHTILLYYHDCMRKLFEACPKEIHLIAIIVLFSVLGVDRSLVLCLLFFRLETSFMTMYLFYKRNPSLLPIYLPKVISPPNSRGMWSKAGKVLEEALTSPGAQTVVAGIAAMSVWKGLDLYETSKQEGIAAADRASQERMATADRNAEDIRHEKTLRMEREERAKDRESQGRKHA